MVKWCPVSGKGKWVAEVYRELDLIKNRKILVPAYDDKKGITRDFNLNLLHRTNRELGGNFVMAKYIHRVFYNESEGIVSTFLESIEDQEIKLQANQKTFFIKRGEMINTEISRKYSLESLNRILIGSWLSVLRVLTDKQNLLADFVLNKQVS